MGALTLKRGALELAGEFSASDLIDDEIVAGFEQDDDPRVHRHVTRAIERKARRLLEQAQVDKALQVSCALPERLESVSRERLVAEAGLVNRQAWMLVRFGAPT